jgi:AcrR family transcriptional regulator
MAEMPRRRRTDGERTYEMILREGADVASIEGLSGLTIGSLAARLGLSKSGLFTHFGSKEELQLATIDAARARYVARVLQPALSAPRGVARLRAVCERVLDYLAAPEFPGGCFFCVVAAEFHARPGTVRDAIMLNRRYKRELLANLVAEAQALGELAREVEPKQLAFELESVLDAANWSDTAQDRQRDLEHARRAVSDLIAQALARRAHTSAAHAAFRKRSKR